MRPCALSTMLNAPKPDAMSLTVLVTIPLSQRKRSSPRTATRRIQPRSCAAALVARAAVSPVGASNSCGVTTPRYSAVRGGLTAEFSSEVSGVGRADTASLVSVIRATKERLRVRFLRIYRARPHPDYSLGIRCGLPAAGSWEMQGEGMSNERESMDGKWHKWLWTAAICLGLAATAQAQQVPSQQPQAAPAPPPSTSGAQAPGKPNSNPANKPEIRITPEQAKQLF